MVWLTTNQNNERDMKLMEEYVSRFGALQDTVKDCLEEKAKNHEIV